jgi:hypothetical protein
MQGGCMLFELWLGAMGCLAAWLAAWLPGWLV